MVIMMNKEYLEYPSIAEMIEVLKILNDDSIEPLQRIRKGICKKHLKRDTVCSGCFFDEENHKYGLPCSATLGVFDLDDFEVIKANILKYFRQSGMLFEDIEVKRFKRGCKK